MKNKIEYSRIVEFSALTLIQLKIIKKALVCKDAAVFYAVSYPSVQFLWTNVCFGSKGKGKLRRERKEKGKGRKNRQEENKKVRQLRGQ